MLVEDVFELIRQYNNEGPSPDKSHVFVMGEDGNTYAPLRYLQKRDESIELKKLQANGFARHSFWFSERNGFRQWYKEIYKTDIPQNVIKEVVLFHKFDQQQLAKTLEELDRQYNYLREECILVNNKNLPVQLGEWYAKKVFGLRQVKSTSQRGFDFNLNGDRVEVKVHWNDKSSPKGVKVKKSLLELSNSLILIYVAKNFMIREICFLDSSYVLKKFGDKGHTTFIKDPEIQQYFFSKASKKYVEVVDMNFLLKFSSPSLTMNIQDLANRAGTQTDEIPEGR